MFQTCMSLSQWLTRLPLACLQQHAVIWWRAPLWLNRCKFSITSLPRVVIHFKMQVSKIALFFILAESYPVSCWWLQCVYFCLWTNWLWKNISFKSWFRISGKNILSPVQVASEWSCLREFYLKKSRDVLHKRQLPVLVAKHHWLC